LGVEMVKDERVMDKIRCFIKQKKRITKQIADIESLPLHICQKCGNTTFYIYCINPLADQTADIYICSKCGEEV
jgi:predicted RNA-binding Zn-ribbon protein involved in translation (DUF1610 family)